MKRILLAFSTAAALTLAACALTPAQVSTEIATIQADCRAACSVIPNTLDVAALITASAIPAVGATVEELAAISTAICNAIGPAPASARFHYVKDEASGRAFKVWTPPVTDVTINGQVVPVHFL